MARIALWSLGGTIAMAPYPDVGGSSDGGVSPRLSADDFVSQIARHLVGTTLVAETLASVGSANLSIGFLCDLAQRIVDEPADAIVLAQGTDTLEESAYLLSLLVGNRKSVILTGAMRPASSLSSDGPGNLLRAAQLAEALCSDHPPMPAGVYVVMNGDIHDPACVTKAHTSALEAFVSDGGPLGRVDEGRVYVRGVPRAQNCYPLVSGDCPPVRMVTITLDDDPDWVPHALEGMAGLVVAAYGAGHVSEAWADMLEAIARYMPVILASRTGQGPIFQSTYAYKGAEMDLIARGLMPAGQLPANKARLALMVALAQSNVSWRVAMNAMTA